MQEQVEAATTARFTNMPGWLITQTAHHAHRLVTEGMAAVGARGYHYRALITITPAGRRQLRRLDKQVTRIQADLLAPLAPDERDQLIRLLRRVLDHHTRAGTITP
jgi:hypothetical protein